MSCAWSRVLRAVAKAVDQDAAGDRAIGAGVAGLGRGCELERPNGSRQGFAGCAKSDSAQRPRRQTGSGELDEASTSQSHGQALSRTFINVVLMEVESSAAAMLGTADHNSGAEDKQASHDHLERRRQYRRIHPAIADEGDDGKLDN